MQTDGEPTLASVSKWNLGKVDVTFSCFISGTLEITIFNFMVTLSIDLVQNSLNLRK